MMGSSLLCPLMVDERRALTNDTAEVTRIKVDRYTNTNVSVAVVEHSNPDDGLTASLIP